MIETNWGWWYVANTTANDTNTYIINPTPLPEEVQEMLFDEWTKLLKELQKEYASDD